VYKAMSIGQQTVTTRKYAHGLLSWLKTKSRKLKLTDNEAVAAKLLDKCPESEQEWPALTTVFGHCPAHVPKPYDRFDQTGSNPPKEFQITEAITGDSLSRYAVGNYGLLKKVGKAMLQGLDCIHSKAKYLHRDLKLPNMLLDSNNNPRFIDFGESLPIGSDFQNRPLQQTVQYEPAWGPPSCLNGACTLAMRYASEVYAIGLSLVQMMFGTGINELMTAIGIPPGIIPSAQGQATFKVLFAAPDLGVALSDLTQKFVPRGPPPTQGSDYNSFVAAITAMCTNPTITAAQALALPFFA